MPYPTFKQTLLGGSNGFKPTNPLGAFPAGVSAFDRTFTRAYNDQRGDALNQQQTQRAFNSGYRKLMRGARGGDPRALGAMMQMAPNYQRIGDIGTAQYGPAAQNQLNVESANAQAIGAVPSVSAMNQNFNNLWSRPTQGPLRTKENNNGVRDTLMQPTGAVPPDPSSAGNTPVANDPFGTGFLPMGENNPFSTSQDQASVMQTGQVAPGLPAPIVNNSANQSYADFSENAASPAVSAMRQPQTPYENAMAAVALRKQQQVEQGVGDSYYPEDPGAVADQINRSVPSELLRGFRKPDYGSVNNTKVVPGIGHVTEVQRESPVDAERGRVMTGRYGTGTAVLGGKQTPAKERVIEEIDPATGKKIKMTTTEWFRKSAERQGVANKFAENEAQIRRIMEMKGTQYQPPPPVR